MKKGTELTAENLGKQLDSMLEGKALLVDPALPKWCQDDYEDRLATGDGRKVSRIGNDYDNLYLIWSFINSRADPEDDYWAGVPREALMGIRDNGKWLRETKTFFHAQGWAEWDRDEKWDRIRASAHSG